MRGAPKEPTQKKVCYLHSPLSMIANIPGIIGALIAELSACILGIIFFVRVLTGLSISDARNIYSAHNKVKELKEQEEDALSVGLMSKFLYPLILRNNVQMKSEQYTICDTMQIRDEYRWLEASENAAGRRWLAEQGKCTTRTLLKNTEQYQGLYKAFSNKVQACEAMENIDAVFQRGDKHFFYRRKGLSTRCTQFYVADHIVVDTLDRAVGKVLSPQVIARPGQGMKTDTDDRCRVLLSAEDLAGSNGKTTAETSNALIGTWICGEGNGLAYATVSGEGLVTLRVRDTNSGMDFPGDVLTEGIHAANITVAWASYKQGFFYTRLVQSAVVQGASGLQSTISRAKGQSHAVYFHKLRTSQDQDVCVHTAPTPADNVVREFFTLRMSTDSRYLLVSASDELPADIGLTPQTDTSLLMRPNRLYYMDVKYQGGWGPVVKLVDDAGGEFCWEFIANKSSALGPLFWFKTNYCADKFRVVCITLPDATTVQSMIDTGDLTGLKALMRMAWMKCIEWISESPTKLLERASVATQNVLVLKYRRLSTHGHDVLIYDFIKPQTTESYPAAELPKEECDSIEGPWCDFLSSSVYYRTVNHSDPGRIWRARVSRDAEGSISFLSLEPLFTPTIPGFSMYDYETSEQTVEPIVVSKFGKSSKDEDSNLRSNIVEQSFLLFRERGEPLPSRPLSGRTKRLSRIKIGGDSSENLSGISAEVRTPPSSVAGSIDEGRPCILVVHAGFGANAAPAFSAPLAFFVKDFRASVCVLCIRAPISQDQAVNQVLETAQHLVDIGVTSSQRLGLLAGTTGATLCAAALNKRPDMFGAAVLQDGIYDLLRLQNMNPPMKWIHEDTLGAALATVSEDKSVNVHKEPSLFSSPSSSPSSSPPSSTWSAEIGDVANSAEACTRLLQISPLHNVRAYWVRDDELCYPAVLVRANKNATVNYTHSMKYTAELQRVWGANERANNPVLVDVEVDLPCALKDAEMVLFLAQYCGAINTANRQGVK